MFEFIWNGMKDIVETRSNCLSDYEYKHGTQPLNVFFHKQTQTSISCGRYGLSLIRWTQTGKFSNIS